MIGKPVEHWEEKNMWNEYQLPMRFIDIHNKWKNITGEPEWKPGIKYKLQIPLDSEGNKLKDGEYEGIVIKLGWMDELEYVEHWLNPPVPIKKKTLDLSWEAMEQIRIRSIKK